MGVRRILAGAFTAPLLLVTTACGGGDTSVAEPPISPHSSTSSPTDPPRRESPEHFIRRWAAAEMQMENTGDVSEYLILSRGCGPCRKLASQVAGYYQAGGFVRWGGWKILSIRRYQGDPEPMYVVHSKSRPTEYRRASGSTVQRFSGGSITYVLALKRHNNSWFVTNKSELEA